MRKIHFRSSALFVNAGMKFPKCHENATLLDTEKSSWETSGDIKEVDCKNCLRIFQKLSGGNKNEKHC